MVAQVPGEVGGDMMRVVKGDSSLKAGIVCG